MKPVLTLAAAVAAGLLCHGGAIAREVAYHYAPLGAQSTYLIDWQGSGSARVVSTLGATSASVAPYADGKLITYESPITLDVPGQIDRCGETYTQRLRYKQLMVREPDKRSANIVEIAESVHLGGCDDGLTESRGDPDDPGLAHVATPMNKRPLMADVVPGQAIAGLSEEPWLGDAPFLPADVVALQAGGTIRFESSGHVFPAALGADGWLLIDLPSGQRAYTRLHVDAATAGETWMLAERAGGLAQRVAEVTVVKPLAGAGFGSVKQAARIWEWGLFKGTETPGTTWLYRDGTGEREVGGAREPIVSWYFEGQEIMQIRQNDWVLRERRWVPLRNEGKHRWVMESEWWTYTGGSRELLIRPRVAYFTDLGKAVRP